MKNSLFVFTLLFMTSQLLNAQSLSRKGSLGAYIGGISDSLRQVHGLKEAEGAYIQRVIPNSTAAAIGMQADDIVLSLNGQIALGSSGLVNLAQQLIGNEAVEIEILRQGKAMKLSGKVVPKPKEQSDIAEVIYDQVAVADGQLRSIIYKPKSAGPHPAIFFIQGYTCSSIDYYFDPQSNMRQLFEGLVKEGFVVFRVEKPGMGDSKNAKPCAQIGFKEEVAAFEAAYKAMQQYDFIDQDKLYIFGHSMGGVIGPVLAEKYQPKGIAVYGTVGKAWFEYMVDIFRVQQERLGMEYLEVEQSTKEMIPFLYEYLLEKKTPAELLQNPAFDTLIQNGAMSYNGEDQFLYRHYTFWQELSDVDITKAWVESAAHALVIYGEYDIQAIGPDYTKTIADAVNAYDEGKGTFVLLPKTEHGFTQLDSFEEYLRRREDGSFNRNFINQHFNTDLIDIISNWIKGHS